MFLVGDCPALDKIILTARLIIYVELSSRSVYVYPPNNRTCVKFNMIN